MLTVLEDWSEWHWLDQQHMGRFQQMMEGMPTTHVGPDKQSYLVFDGTKPNHQFSVSKHRSTLSLSVELTPRGASSRIYDDYSMKDSVQGDIHWQHEGYPNYPHPPRRKSKRLRSSLINTHVWVEEKRLRQSRESKESNSVASWCQRYERSPHYYWYNQLWRRRKSECL